MWSFKGLPTWLSGNESPCQYRRCKRHGFDPWVGTISWRRKWQPTPVSLPGKFQGRRSLVGYSPWICKRVRHRVRHDWLTMHALLRTIICLKFFSKDSVKLCVHVEQTRFEMLWDSCPFKNLRFRNNQKTILKCGYQKCSRDLCCCCLAAKLFLTLLWAHGL